MEKQYTQAFHQNYIKAVRHCMAAYDLDSRKEAADWLGINKVSLYKIMDESQAPTVEQGITLCMKGNIDANWLFLNLPTGVKGIVERENLKSNKRSNTLSQIVK